MTKPKLSQPESYMFMLAESWAPLILGFALGGHLYPKEPVSMFITAISFWVCTYPLIRNAVNSITDRYE